MGERREGVQVLEVAAIEPDLRGPRQTFGDEPLAELANSIRQHGVLQPLVVHAPVDEATARMLSLVEILQRQDLSRERGAVSQPAVPRVANRALPQCFCS